MTDGPNSVILYKPEQKLFDHHPKYSSSQRKDIFFISKRLRKSLDKFRGYTRAFLFVKYVYFRSHNKFYDNFSAHDFKKACSVLGLKYSSDSTLDKRTNMKVESEILKIFDFKRLTARNEDIFIFFIHSMMKKRKSNKDIFDFLIEEFARRKVAVPDYSTIEALMHKAFKLFDPYEQVSKMQLTRTHKSVIEEILENKIEESEKNKPNLTYKSSKLKQIDQSQKLKDIKTAISKYRDLKRYYHVFESFIELLNLDGEGVKKTAQEFKKMDHARIKRLPGNKRNVLIMCFIKDQYFKYTDHFVEIILDSVQKLQRKAKSQYKEQVSTNQSEKNKTFLELVDTASDDNQLLIEVIRICQDKIRSSDKKIDDILEILKGKQRGRQKRVEHYELVKDNLINEKHLLSTLLLDNFTSTKNKVKPILEVLEFESDSTKGVSLIRSLSNIFMNNFVDVDNDEFLSENEKLTVKFSESKVDMYLVYLYLTLSNFIKSGQMNLKHSYKYKSLNEYLISIEDWQKNKDQLLKKSNLERFADIEQTLDHLKTVLDTQYKKTNIGIKEGLNDHFKNKGNGKFTIQTPATDYSTENLLYPYFPRNEFVSLAEVLATINQKTQFLDSFAHLKRSYLKKRPDPEVFIAGIIALGCNIGERKMGKISKSINTNTLNSAITWYFSKESPSTANDAIVNFMNELSLPKILKQNRDSLHTSSDGSRWTVSRENILSKHSFKYFGLNKGVNINTHVDERHLPFYSKVISTSEREAASVLDGLLHNDHIRSEIHSTDTHGYTEALFAIMNLLGFKFAPRIKSIKDQRLYSFKTPFEHKQEKEIILPHRKINTGIIIEHFDEILRIAATIGTKHTEASQIFKRLNSYSNENPLYRAIKELGKVYKSIFVLEYLDNMNLRQKIEKQLNKAEETQRFSRAISFGNNQELIGEDFEALEIGELSRRLIKNAIICWNYLFLTKKVLREKSKKSRSKILYNVSKSSILHWQHLNFLGEYDFSSKKTNDSVGLAGPALEKANVLKMWDETQQMVQ